MSGSGPDPTRLAHAVVAEVLGATAAVGPVRVLQTTPDSAVLRVTAGAPARELVLKLVALDARPAVDLERTATVMRRAATAGIPVADVLSADGTGCLDGWQYLLTRHVPGRPWREVRPQLTPSERAGVERGLATALLQLLSVPVTGFGELDQSGQPEGRELVAALRHRARLRTAPGPRLELAERLLDRSADLFVPPGPAALCHDDLHHDNVLVAPGPAGWQVVAVLDWDKAWAGPADSDLARLAFWDGMTGPAFWAVLAAARPGAGEGDERRLVHQLLWCLEFPVDTPRHRADTERLCRRLGLEPPSP